MSKTKKSMSASVPKRKKGRGVAIIYAFIAVVLLSLIWFSFGANVLSPAKQSGQSGVPDYLGSLKLATKTEGPQALDQINRLHGTDIKLVSGYIAEYAAIYGGEKVTVWVGRAKDENDAAELLQRMAQAIGKGGTPFSAPKQVDISGHQIYQVQGPGGDNFFYQSHESKTDVVWLTVNSTNPKSLVEKAIMIF